MTVSVKVKDEKGMFDRLMEKAGRSAAASRTTTITRTEVLYKVDRRPREVTKATGEDLTRVYRIRQARGGGLEMNQCADRQPGECQVELTKGDKIR